MQHIRTCVLVALALTGTAASAQVGVGTAAYDDLYRTWDVPVGDVHQGNSTPRSLRLAFDPASRNVVASWRRPAAIYQPRVAKYEIRMRKDTYAWGEWQPAGPIGVDRSFITIYNVDPGTTYYVEVRARNGRAISHATSAKVTIPQSVNPAPG